MNRRGHIWAGKIKSPRGLFGFKIDLFSPFLLQRLGVLARRMVGQKRRAFSTKTASGKIIFANDDIPPHGETNVMNNGRDGWLAQRNKR